MADFPSELESALVERPQNVIILAGAGVSMATDPGNPCCGWTGLLQHGLDWCRTRHSTVPTTTLDLFQSLLREGQLIPAASFIKSTLQGIRHGEFNQWLANSVGSIKCNADRVVRALSDMDVRIATTNYDSLIESVSSRGIFTWVENTVVWDFLRGNTRSIFHIHGHFTRPDSVILSEVDYGVLVGDGPKSIKAALESMFSRDIIVFVGCGDGLNDPNFRRLFEWSETTLAESKSTHFRLVRDSEFDAVARECTGLPVQPVKYGREYSDLGTYLENLVSKMRSRRDVLTPDAFLVQSRIKYGLDCEAVDNQRSTLSAGQYVERRMTIARDLAKSGGPHSATLEMQDLYRRESANLSTNDRFRFGFEVVEALLDDRLTRLAQATLHDLGGHLRDDGVFDDVVERFQRLHIRCMNELSQVPETITAINEALPTAVGDVRVRLEAVRAEIQLLHGDLQDAMEGLDEELPW